MTGDSRPLIHKKAGLGFLTKISKEAEAARPPEPWAWDVQGVPPAVHCCHMVSPDSVCEAATHTANSERWKS